MALAWNAWYRSNGCVYWMDRTTFMGKSFSSIFWNAMRLVFFDEKGTPGLLYKGTLYPIAETIVATNGRRSGFTKADESAMLKQGSFHYFGGLLPLRFEGPDQADIGKVWGKAPIGGTEVDVGFYDLVQTATNGLGLGQAFPPNADGLRMLTWFTGAIVLHEVMHNHSFRHPTAVNWTPGSTYASSLPHVAALSVLMASPDWGFFQPLIAAGFPAGGYPCCATIVPPPTPTPRQSGWRWCVKCEGLFFGETSSGRCPKGSGHDKTGSGNYALAHNAPDDRGQHLWRWCNKCQGMFFVGNRATTTTARTASVETVQLPGTTLKTSPYSECPAGGLHDPYGSGDYSLTQNVAEAGTQGDWRWCNKCQGLFFAGHGPGVCPQGGGHDKTGSGDYKLLIVA
jgi:hypothetical protein